MSSNGDRGSGIWDRGSEIGDRGSGIGDRGSGIGDRSRDRFDTAIDRAAREMLDVEPPPGLRGRVMDRIELNDPVASAFRRKFWLVAAPVAAAVIVLAVTAPWRDAAPPAPTDPPGMAQAEPPRVAPQPIAPTTTEPPAEPTGPRAPWASSATAPRTAAPRPDRVVAASDVPEVEDVNFTTIAALAGPQPIAIERLADPLPSSMRSIEPAPLEIRALEVTALPETPRERREE